LWWHSFPAPGASFFFSSTKYFTANFQAQLNVMETSFQTIYVVLGIFGGLASVVMWWRGALGHVLSSLRIMQLEGCSQYKFMQKE